MAVGAQRRRRTRERVGERQRYRFTCEQVRRMVEAGILPEDQRFELLDGVLYAVTKGELHNAIVGAVADAIRRLTPEGFLVREEKSSLADEESAPEPDVAVCEGTRFAYVPDLPPLEKFALVVEVSHHSHEADHFQKLAKYAAGGVPCYWIVDVARRRVLVHREPEMVDGVGRYGSLSTLKPGETLDVEIGGRLRGRVPVGDLFPPEPQNLP